MSTVEVLKQARALVAQGWCQGVHARSRSGAAVNVLGERACRFCAVGAVLRLTGNVATQAYDRGVSALVAVGERRHNRNFNIPEWNDRPGRRQAEVLALYDAAIELAETQ